MVPISVWFMLMLIYIGRKRNAVKKNKEALLVSSKETGLEVNADKTWCMIMSQDHNAGQIYNVQKD
jgi:hypothetical protein